MRRLQALMRDLRLEDPAELEEVGGLAAWWLAGC